MHGVRVPMWQTQSAGPVRTAQCSHECAADCEHCVTQPSTEQFCTEIFHLCCHISIIRQTDIMQSVTSICISISNLKQCEIFRHSSNTRHMTPNMLTKNWSTKKTEYESISYRSLLFATTRLFIWWIDVRAYSHLLRRLCDFWFGGLHLRCSFRRWLFLRFALTKIKIAWTVHIHCLLSTRTCRCSLLG